MRYFVFFLGMLAATPAVAGALSLPGASHHGRAFWMNDQVWHDPQAHPPKTQALRFTMTYLDGVASRFRLGPEGHANLFEHKLGGSDVGVPALVGTVNDGAPMLMLRWNTGE